VRPLPVRVNSAATPRGRCVVLLASASLLFALSKIEVISHYAVVQVQVVAGEPPTTGMWKTAGRTPHAQSCLSGPSLLHSDGSTWDRLHEEVIVPRKEVIQPHLPVRLPCYDFTPITDPTLDACPLAVSPAASGVADFRGVTGGVYKTRERIHRGVLTHGY
jgi:hypothetical protein